MSALHELIKADQDEANDKVKIQEEIQEEIAENKSMTIAEAEADPSIIVTVNDHAMPYVPVEPTIPIPDGYQD
jgi:predicted Holliday junction resolvase-like endonuclease